MDPAAETYLLKTVFDDNAALWLEASQLHPFLQGCITGAVTTAQFDTWLVQDFKYVHHFLAFLKAALQNATVASDQETLQGGVTVVSQELVWFQTMAKDRGVDLNVASMTQMENYAQFMIAMGAESYAYQLVVLYLVEKVYLEAWCHVESKGGESGPYAKFAKQWSGAEFRSYVDKLGKMALAASGPFTPAWAEKVQSLFIQVMQLENGFWDMAVKSHTATPRPPLPPFTYEGAVQKVRMAEDAWNTRDPKRVAMAYTPDSQWRNRSQFITGRPEIEAFLTDKWSVETDYRLVKEIWAHAGNRIAVRFAYEWHDAAGQWYRSYGNENWEFDDLGFMRARHASINDVPIEEGARKFRWARDPSGASKRPADHPGLTELGL
jgi:nuclear transport factor 2 (NTF2) superfamily protein/thiaminase